MVVIVRQWITEFSKTHFKICLTLGTHIQDLWVMVFKTLLGKNNNNVNITKRVQKTIPVQNTCLLHINKRLIIHIQTDELDTNFTHADYWLRQYQCQGKPIAKKCAKERASKKACYRCGGGRQTYVRVYRVWLVLVLLIFCIL